MCCFSGPVVHVANTRIFARHAGEAGQHLAYAMSFSAKVELAMVLPLPVPTASPDDAATFIDLSGYPDMFEDMKRGFPQAEPAFSGGRSLVPQSRAMPNLVVHDVGSFEASFVPSIGDFSRLDRRFRLSQDVWDALPQYRDWGFAVFKLKGPGLWNRLMGAPNPHEVHPMAFTFPTREPSRLFFPTVHVHDGTVAKAATFDHALYAQGVRGWEETQETAGRFMRVAGTGGLVIDAACQRRQMLGRAPNQDQWVERA